MQSLKSYQNEDIFYLVYKKYSKSAGFLKRGSQEVALGLSSATASLCGPLTL